MRAQLVGIPGSGKTTIVENLAERYPGQVHHVRAKALPVSELIRKHPLHAARAILPISFVSLLAITRRPTGISLRNQVAPIATLLSLLIQFDALQDEDSGDSLFVFDEFVLQRVIGIFSHGLRPPSRWRVLLALACLRRYEAPAVFVGAKPELAEKRVEERPEGWPTRWAALPEKNRPLVLAQQSVLLDELFVLARNAVRIDSDQDPRESAARAFEAFSKLRLERNALQAEVIHFVFNFGKYGGASRQATALARNGAASAPLFYSADEGRKSISFESTPCGQFRLIRLPDRLIPAICSVLTLSAIHRARIFHLHGLIGAGLIPGHLLRKKIVLKTTLLGSDDFASIRKRRFGGILLAMVRKVHINIAPSRAIEQVNRATAPSVPVEYVPNGIDLDRSNMAQPKTGLPPTFSVVGLICERKQTHLAIRRFVKDYAHLDHAKLYVVGPDGDSDSYSRLCREIASEARPGQVEFTGFQEPSEVAEILAQSLGYFCFSQAEGMPNALIEAMASNCVPITSEIGGVAREIIRHESEGFILSEDTPSPTADQLVACSAGLGPRRRIEADFSLATIREAYASIYTKLLESPVSSKVA